MTDNKNKVQIVDEIINDDYPRYVSKLWFDDIAKKITSPNGKLSIVSGRVHSSIVFSKQTDPIDWAVKWQKLPKSV